MSTNLLSAFPHFYRAMELAVARAGHRFPPLSELRDPGGHSAIFATSAREYALVLLDVTLDVRGNLRLIEANGSNAALSSAAENGEGDHARALHMAATFTARHRAGEPVAVLIGHQAGFHHIPEFYARAGCFAAALSHRHHIHLRDPGELPGSEEVSIVVGSLDELAAHCATHGTALNWRDRPVRFATNTNLLPELVRRGVISHGDGQPALDLSFFHEGRLASLIHDKARQQDVARDTGIEPLRHAEAWSWDECLQVVTDFHRDGVTAVLKMNGGSGGTGIEFCAPGEVCPPQERIRALMQSATEKYGSSVERTLFPIRIFEFAQSTPYLIKGQPHLWDLRVQCLISPGQIAIAPSLIRLCPEAFSGDTAKRDSVVSNLTGRSPTLRFMRAPWRPHADVGASEIEACGMTVENYTHLLRSCAAWCEAALCSAG